MAERAPIDWDAFRNAGEQGQLMELLEKLPRERWAEWEYDKETILHSACRGPNAKAVAALLKAKVEVHSRNDIFGVTPVHYAVLNAQPRILEMLCAAGADLRAQTSARTTPLDFAVDQGDFTARVLMANGVRLSTVRSDYRFRIKAKLAAFERGVLRCRAAVVAMMRVKKAGELWQWDKFLLREMAYAVWATRYEEKWQN